MKKSILAITALTMMLASCSQDETIDVTSREAITFGNAFIENATRAVDNSYKNEGFSAQFHVYGTITNKDDKTANIFNKELVEKKNGNWVYNEANTQYWIPGNTYNFWAVVDGNIKGVSEVVANESDNYKPTQIKLLNALEQKDILWAKAEAISYDKGEKTVSFTFEHLMAKAIVAVKNEIETNNGYTYKVKDITMSAVKSAIYDIATESWKEHKDKDALSFGNIGSAVTDIDTGEQAAVMIGFFEEKESAYARLLIPSSNNNKTNIELKFKFELSISPKFLTFSLITSAQCAQFNPSNTISLFIIGSALIFSPPSCVIYLL